MHIGIIGCGQLARMLAQAGAPIGATFSFVVEPGADPTPVKGLGQQTPLRDCMTPAELYAALDNPSVITVEKEHVDVPLLEALSAFCRVAPNPQAVHITQNRSREKNFLNQLGIPTVGFAQADSEQALRTAAQQIGFPIIIKSEEAGYDGKNQWRIRSQADLDKFCAAQQHSALDLVVEQWVSFQAEVSMVAARNTQGEKTFYALTENRHQNGILLTSRVPAPHGSEALSQKAQHYLNTLLDALNYVGVLAMECFILGDQLLVNELAPRVHNSGHWTQQGSNTSQFENHVRAILGMPLGQADLRHHAAMVNLLGIEASAGQVASPQTTLHWYDKTCKPGRKVGHINIQDECGKTVDDKLNALLGVLYHEQTDA
jgi:5-(carboxyamino)imidazole ribonucleotide synthase